MNPKSMSVTSWDPESRTRVHVHTGLLSNARLSSVALQSMYVHLQLSGSFNEEISHFCPGWKQD